MLWKKNFCLKATKEYWYLLLTVSPDKKNRLNLWPIWRIDIISISVRVKAKTKRNWNIDQNLFLFLCNGIQFWVLKWMDMKYYLSMNFFLSWLREAFQKTTEIVKLVLPLLTPPPPSAVMGQTKKHILKYQKLYFQIKHL